MDYKEEIEQILKESREEIKEKTKEAIKEKIVDSLNWKLGSEISGIVDEVIKEELEEDIRQLVVDSKEEILKGIKPAFANIGAEMAKNFETKAIESLSNNWKSREIAKSLFD